MLFYSNEVDELTSPPALAVFDFGCGIDGSDRFIDIPKNQVHIAFSFTYCA